MKKVVIKLVPENEVETWLKAGWEYAMTQPVLRLVEDQGMGGVRYTYAFALQNERELD